MASVSGTNSSINSFFNTYGNANAITGLASGMDTEGMIEQAVSGFLRKIESLQQKQTLVQWKQTQLRSMITMLNNLNENYASYRSKTNLLSPTFFTSAMTSIASGVNADKIIATGGSRSNISINSVSKLATAATYQVDASALFSGVNDTGEKIDWEKLNLYDSADRHITVTLDGVAKSIRIGDLADTLGTIRDTDSLAKALQTQLDKNFGAGRVTVEEQDGALKFGAGDEGSTLRVQCDAPKLGLGSGIMNYLDTSTTRVVEALGMVAGYNSYTYDGKTYTNVDGRLLDERGKALTLEINGAEIEVNATTTVANLISNINLSNAGVTASYSQLTNQLTFTARETGSGGRIDFGGALGSAFRGGNAPDRLTLSNLFGDIEWDENGEATLTFQSDGSFPSTLKLKKGDTLQDLFSQIERIGVDDPSSGDYFIKFEYDSVSGTYSMKDRSGNPLQGEKFTLSIPGTGDVTLAGLAQKANGINASSTFTAGQDAELNVTINGVTTNLTRSSNTFDLDGMSVTLKDTFEDGAVTFTGTVDSEKIVTAVKSFVEEYNALIKAVREAYTTQPLEKNSSTHAKYEPLTDDEKEGLSDKAIEEYEEKAKTGLLFMDGDLSGLYSELRSILMSNQGALAEIGITVAYDKDTRSNFLEVDEEKLSRALENDVSKVADLFSGENGLMSSVQSTAKKYASTSYGDYGILVRKAGADESAISQRDNAYQKEIDRIETQIDNWRSKLSAKVDYYSRQFSMLEQMMGNFNNQSSMLMSMMGY